MTSYCRDPGVRRERSLPRKRNRESRASRHRKSSCGDSRRRHHSSESYLPRQERTRNSSSRESKVSPPDLKSTNSSTESTVHREADEEASKFKALQLELKQTMEEASTFKTQLEFLKTPYGNCYVCHDHHDDEGAKVAPRVNWPSCECTDKICCKCLIPYLSAPFLTKKGSLNAKKLWREPTFSDASGTSFETLIMFALEVDESSTIQRCGTCKRGELSIFLSDDACREAPEKSVLVFDGLQSCHLCDVSFRPASGNWTSSQIFKHYIWMCPKNSSLPCPFSPSCKVQRHPCNRHSEEWRLAEMCAKISWRKRNEGDPPPLLREADMTLLLQMHIPFCTSSWTCNSCEQTFKINDALKHIKTDCQTRLLLQQFLARLDMVKEKAFCEQEAPAFEKLTKELRIALGAFETLVPIETE